MLADLDRAGFVARQAAFLEAMNMLETELSARDTTDQGSGWPAATLAHTRFSGTAADEREPAHARCRAPTYCIQRMVLLTHPRSRLGNCARPTVHVATTTGQVIRMLDDSTTKLSGHEREQVERLILRDHGFHASRRKPH